jgi:hypothetical protein
MTSEGFAARFIRARDTPGTLEASGAVNVSVARSFQRCTHENCDSINFASNDEVERREAAPTTNEADLSQSSTPSLGLPKTRPAIARTDC